MPPKEVPISIDKEHPKSPSPTTGSALYLLGKVAAGYDLWRETKGKGDDELIPNDSTTVTLSAGDHFYTAQSTLNPGTVGQA
jgi:hypothetical protein